ncbi:MFS transporter [Aestuariicoccus sp. MJ-SS9]|uniref:MFS transporter n=1 Tax=Aestuariicoccus sp. MJ-SS9 TaxID=3079855 RepID=UPI0029087365|nr:MFS transporter [Aestuariicoccus sp. MJ-SS9]MDU8910162.1 MFS transporter [Aestuariicoccus sp. MJ-SS9]
MKEISKRMIASPIMASIAFVMELTLVPLLLPSIRDSYGLGIGELAWFFNSYAASMALGVILGGWVGDVFGVRRVFAAGVLMFAAGALVVMAAGTFETLIAGRIVQGLGGGLFSPLVPILLTRAMPKRPGKILIIWGSIAGYCAAIAPLIAGMTLDGTGWQMVFALFAVLAGVALLLFGRGPAAPGDGATRRFPDLRLLLRVPMLWLAFGYIFCTYGVILFYLFKLPLRLTEAGLGPQAIGMSLAAMWLSFSISGTLLRNAVDGTHLQKIVLVAPLLIAAGFALLDLGEGIVAVGASAVFIGVGFACSNAPSTQLVLRHAPSGLSGISASLDISFARLGGVTTVALLAQAGAGSSFSVILAMSVLASVFALITAGQTERVPV